MLIFSLATILLMVMAGLNYINQALALSLYRTREVGIRKVVGASRFHLIGQYISESLFLVILFAGMSLWIMWLVLPLFNDVSYKSLGLSTLAQPPIYVYALRGVFILVLLTGAYPAFFLSRFDPVTVFIRLSQSSRSGE